ncbi:hypothetical protein AN958_08401 [Leucoagaricus sp. SymC.cos]|nr:hypothetical protein AN958_08401 [Leucoagaricus sp. SymC.cos]
MLAFTALCFTLLFSAVLGFPLAQRDVFNPHITNPRQGTVWIVGSQETVTWETDNIPPDSQLTNPNGRVILGFMENNSLNLQLDHPLAENFKLRTGQVTITVPDVPPREDYIIVLMGDSGNASPAFAITSIKGGPSSSSSRPASGTSNTSISASAASTSTDNSPPFTGSAITGGNSGASTSATPISDSTPSASVPESTPTSPVSLRSSVSLPSTTSSNSATVAGTAVGAATSTSAAWSVHSYKLWSVIAAPMALSLLMI